MEVLRFTFLSLILGVAAGCSLATPRPVQDISNADAALRAAKELHADTLAPEYYRAASENFYNAKKQYRLKNFDMAKKFATKSRQLSEQAEYSAYLKGGATPEVALQQTSGEGASGDPEESMQKAKSLHEEKEAEKMRIKKESQELQARDHEEPTLQQNHSAEPELEVKESPKEEKKPDEKKPEAPGGYE